METHLKFVARIFLVFGGIALAFSIWALKEGIDSHGELKILGLIILAPLSFLAWSIFQIRLGLAGRRPEVRRNAILVSGAGFLLLASLAPVIGFSVATIGVGIWGYCLWVLFDGRTKQLLESEVQADRVS